jgi:2-methylcitrate dehydratase PrpD
MPLARQYAQFISRLAWRDLPDDVRAATFDRFADWFANAVAGYGSPLTLALRAVASGGGVAVRAGDLGSADPLAAALINASAAHALEFDDMYRAGLYHPGAPVIGAALPAAGIVGASGADLLAGIVAGYELSLRLAAAINPAHYKIWHTTGTVGAFAAAAAAARIFRLSPEQTASALGLAGTQAAGLWEVLPEAPVAKNLHPAKAAHSGLLAALLARSGVAGPATIFEGEQGFFAATVPTRVDLSLCVAGLGERWLTPETTVKAYPVCGHAMTPIEAALQLAGQISVDALESIEVRAHPVSLQVAGDPDPTCEEQAKFSIPYCVAVALTKKRVGLAEFAPDTLHDPNIRRLLGCITLVADDSLARVPGQRPARLTLQFANDVSLSAQADVRKGDPEWPMTDAEKRDKWRRLMEPIWGRTGAKDFVAAVPALAGARSVPGWVEELRGSVGK